MLSRMSSHFYSSNSAPHTSTVAAISHMLEMVASSRDMVSRVGRSSLTRLSPLVPVPVV